MTERKFGFGAAGDVFWTALKLGLTSFGGPIAHIGYFREEYVGRRQWLSDRSFAELVALCQFLPGPASSQLGMAIGAKRAGVLGALAAWIGFTMPSALLMVAFAFGAQAAGIGGAGWLQGLKLAAVAIVAQAVWSMSRTLAPDRPRATLALVTACAAVLWPSMAGQLVPLLFCAIIGIAVYKSKAGAGAEEGSGEPPIPIGRKLAAAMLALFIILLIGLPIASGWSGSAALTLIDSVYRAGSLVFGGGHAVLPMLETELLSGKRPLLTSDQFMAGYGAVQAVPGPLFTFAAYIGAAMETGYARIGYAMISLFSIFLPSFLLVLGALPFWERLKRNKTAQSALMGINAGIVGILLAALYDPIFMDAVGSAKELAIVIVLFILLQIWKRPPWQAVALAALAGLLFL
ncbi:chromate efflux transporter [Paenibacillus arenilitoris]|uniref:Chromate efflux transporter n=1 Tax=Paenibacillus arenilitoris TaxID=2772299 RepID=A0A927CKL8_9BACL|nr:chromate efflux transporter [Paenibacillus arenilitoris]MBD2869803.1 chromate efflux transporter [Paenibacillus arenilitoris]